MRGSRNEVDIDATPEAVYDVLADPTTYPEWLVGARAIRSVDDDWPAVGSRFHHRIGAPGPLSVPGSTSVRRAERPEVLELGAGMGPFGEARVRFRLRPAGRVTNVAIEEEPRRGLARAAWKLLRPLVAVGLWGRNEVSLVSLRSLVERGAGHPTGSTGHATAPPA